MRIRRRHFLAGATLPLTRPAIASGPSASARQARLDAAMAQAVGGGQTPSMVVLVLEQGRLAYAAALGRRDPRSPAPLALDDRFRLASMTKPVTAVAALMLMEERRIGLHDPVSHHLPEFAALRVRHADGRLLPAPRPPTLRELLNHTAGFSYLSFDRPGVADAYRAAGVDDGLSAPTLSTTEAMRRLATAPLATEPGETWTYGLSSDVLGAVIERVTGAPLGAFVEARIARPLGLRSLAFHAPVAERPRFATVTRQEVAAMPRYAAVEGQAAIAMPGGASVEVADTERVFSPTAYHSGGAGLSGSAGDYARFLAMLAQGGELDGVRLLKRRSVRAMTGAQTVAPPFGMAGWRYGYGIAVLTDPLAARSGAPAGTCAWPGFYGTGCWMDPVGQVAGVALTQTALLGTEAVREAYYDRIA